MKTSRVISVLLLVLICFQASAQNEKFERELASVRSELRNVGLYVMVLDNGNVTYSKGFGSRVYGGGAPMKETDIVRMASISKSFASVAIMQLVEQGKVSLVADVNEILGKNIRNPLYPDIPITLEMLMSHTSGMRDDRQFNDYPPGGGFEYCNVAYSYVGDCVEKISGEYFSSYIRKHIINPLGLEASFKVEDLDASRFVPLYQWSGSQGKYVENQYSYRSGVFPAGGIKMSIRAFAQWMTVLMNGGVSDNGVRILSDSSVRRMCEPLSFVQNYGLGLRQNEDYAPGHSLIGHIGDVCGMTCAMYWDPESSVGFVFVSNGARLPSGDDEYGINRIATVIASHFVH